MPPVVGASRWADRSGPINDYLLNGQAAVGTGKHVKVGGLAPVAISIRNAAGAGTFTVSVFATSEPLEPTDDVHPALITTSANALQTFTEGFNWYWARVTAIGGGALVTIGILAG